MLTDVWRDLIALASAVLTVAGLVYAILQIRKTQSAAMAAKAAAEQARAESHRSFLAYAAANAHRFINETKLHVDHERWEMAAVRMNDLADQAARLVATDPEWTAFADELRKWAHTCTRHAAGELKKFAKPKWITFSVRLQARIDGHFGPFPEDRQEAGDDPSH